MKNEAVMQEMENRGLEVAIEALRDRIARCTEKGELHTSAVPGLALFRREEPTGPISGMYEPSVCLVAQGAKRVLLGEDTFVYRLFGAPPLRDITSLRQLAAGEMG